MLITFSTNATDNLHASVLEEIGRLDQGTLLFLQTRKKGVERGRVGSKLVYDNDLVQVLLWTGFSYESLVRRSRRKLGELLDSGTLISTLTEAARQMGISDAGIETSAVVIQEVREGLDQKLAGWDTAHDSPIVEALGQSPWEPLEVNGVRVPMCRVYRGPGRPADPRAPIPGHIYVQGMKLGEKVVEAAPNGHWSTSSSSKTLTKNLLLSWLPLGLYSQYTLDPHLVAHLVAGEGASKRAVAAQIPVNPEAIRKLFKIA